MLNQALFRIGPARYRMTWHARVPVSGAAIGKQWDKYWIECLYPVSACPGSVRRIARQPPGRPFGKRIGKYRAGEYASGETQQRHLAVAGIQAACVGIDLQRLLQVISQCRTQTRGLIQYGLQRLHCLPTLLFGLEQGVTAPCGYPGVRGNSEGDCGVVDGDVGSIIGRRKVFRHDRDL
ncbi:hypothetical protein D3C77_406720 [compost metagenome]